MYRKPKMDCMSECAKKIVIHRGCASAAAATAAALLLTHHMARAACMCHVTKTHRRAGSATDAAGSVISIWARKTGFMAGTTECRKASFVGPTSQPRRIPGRRCHSAHIGHRAGIPAGAGRASRLAPAPTSRRCRACPAAVWDRRLDSAQCPGPADRGTDSEPVSPL